MCRGVFMEARGVLPGEVKGSCLHKLARLLEQTAL